MQVQKRTVEPKGDYSSNFDRTEEVERVLVRQSSKQSSRKPQIFEANQRYPLRGLHVNSENYLSGIVNGTGGSEVINKSRPPQ